MVVIEVRDVVKTYNGLRVVDRLSLEVERGEIFGLLGPNGCIWRSLQCAYHDGLRSCFFLA